MCAHEKGCGELPSMGHVQAMQVFQARSGVDAMLVLSPTGDWLPVGLSIGI